MEASMNVGVRPIERPQAPAVDGVGRRGDGGGSSAAFSPKTNVAIQNAVDDMAGVLAKIASNQTDAVEKMPEDLQQLIKNVMKQAFSLEETLAQGLGSTLESQRFSMEQLSSFSRMLTQMGKLMDRGMNMEVSDTMQVLLTNLKNLAGTEQGAAFEPVLITKAAFELLDNKPFTELPKEVQQLLLTLQPQGMVQPMQAGEENALGFLKQLVQYFMPRPASTGEAAQMQSNMPGQGMPQNMAQPRQGQGNMPAQNSAQFTASSMQAGQGNAAGQGQGGVLNAGQGMSQNMAQSQQGQGNMPAQNMVQPQQGQGNMPAQNSAQSSAQPMQAGQENAVGQGQGSVSNAGQPAGQGVPQNMAQSQQGQGNMPAQNMVQPQQGQGNIPAQNSAQFTAPSMQAGQGNAAGQGQGSVSNAGQPAGQGVPQNMAQPQQGQGNMSAQNMAQPQQGQGNMSTQNMAQPQQGQGNIPVQNPAKVSGQPLQAEHNMVNGQGNVQESMAQGDHVQRPQQAAMQQAKNQLLNQVMENTPQTMNALRDLAQLLLKDGNVNQKDALLLQSFVNGKEALLSAKEAQQLQQMIRLCQANIPATVQQAALQQNIPDLPRLWAFMQLCDMAYTRNMTARQLKKAGKDVAAFVLSMRNSMEGDNSIVPGQRSLNFMMPMYMGEESTYPAYIHVYDEKQPDPETGEMKKETWLRLCVLTDNIGAVELTCRVYQENQLDMRLFFSSTETANEFRAEAEALRESLKDSKLKLKDIKIGAVGERRFM